MEEQDNKKKAVRRTGIYAGLKLLVIVPGVVVVLRCFLFTSCYIPSSGMENSLFPGDRVVVNKWAYGLRLPFPSLLGYHRIAARPVERGDVVVFNNPHNTSYRGKQLDEGAIFIGRCIGVPGDTLFTDTLFTRVIARELINPDKKRLYHYPVAYEPQIREVLAQTGIENQLMGYNDSVNIRSLSLFELYLIEEATGGNKWIKPVTEERDEPLYPLVVPGKGITVEVSPHNIKLLRNTILLHEGKEAEILNDTLVIEGRKVTRYTFAQDYYWAASNNSVNMADSRLFGFVPRTHLIGKASFVWFSKKKNGNLFRGIDTERFFKAVN